MDACLSFTTVSIFTDTDTYTDHNSRTYGWLALGQEKNVLVLVIGRVDFDANEKKKRAAKLM